MSQIGKMRKEPFQAQPGGPKMRACLVVIYGPEPGRGFWIVNPETMIGRDESNDVVIDLDTVSRRHARVVFDGTQFTLEDLGSVNGTFVHEMEILKAVQLDSGATVRLGGALLKFLSGDNVESLFQEEVRYVSNFDGLTGAYNRQFLRKFLETGIERSLKLGSALSLIMFEVNRFDHIKKSTGALGADALLRNLAKKVKNLVAAEQCFARYEKSRFVVVVPGLGLGEVQGWVEKVRSAAEGKFVFENHESRVKLSFGVASLNKKNAEPQALIVEAESHLLGTVGNGGPEASEARESPRHGPQIVSGKATVGRFAAVENAPKEGSTSSGRSQAVQVLAYSKSQKEKSEDHQAIEFPQDPGLSAGEHPTVFMQVPIKGLDLVRRNLAKPAPGALLAFEIAGERDIVRVLGPDMYREWNIELEREIARFVKAGQGDLFGVWKDRYFLVALGTQEDPERGPRMVADIKAKWSSKQVPELAKGKLTRVVRATILSQEDVLTNAERSLEHLVANLLDDGVGYAGSQEGRLGLPFPIDAPRVLARARLDGPASTGAKRDALEAMVRFIASMGIALLRERADASTRFAGGQVLARYMGQRLSFEGWLTLAAGIAAVMPDASDDIAIETVRSLAPKNGVRLPLLEKMLRIVEDQKRKARDSARPEQDDVEHARMVEEALSEFTHALMPLKHSRLVSVAGVEPFSADGGEDDEKIRYRLYGHQGSREHFPVAREPLGARLISDWCYLLVPNSPPLCLAPVFSQRLCEMCGRIEVFFADRIVLGPHGAQVEVKGVTSHHDASIVVPFRLKDRRLFELMQASE